MDEQWAVTVKRTPGGYASNWLCDNVKHGDQLESLAPNGRFCPADLNADLLLIAGGSGITPIMSIIKTALAAGQGRIALVYANRDEHAVIFAERLREIALTYPERLSAVHWLESVQGTPNRLALRSLFAPHADREVYLCGPAAFMDCAQHALDGVGVVRSRVHLERFVSLSGDPFNQDVSAPIREDADSAANADTQVFEVVVRIDGASHTLTWSRKDTLVELLESHGIDAPHSCRVGDCGTCQCLLVAGHVDMDSHFALEERDIADGMVLACQARPASDHVEIDFAC